MAKVAREMVEKAGVNVDQLLELLAVSYTHLTLPTNREV